MALVLNDDQKMIRDSADGFFKTEAPVAQHRKLRDTADATGFDNNVWAKMAEMGFAGVLVPEEPGGAGFGHVAAGLIMVKEAGGFRSRELPTGASLSTFLTFLVSFPLMAPRRAACTSGWASWTPTGS